MSSGTTQNPSLEEFVRLMIEARLTDLHTCLPAKVVRYDKAKQQADVEILLQRKLMSGNLVTLPVISNVPVMHPRVGSIIIHMPIQVGHIVTLFFAERSMDRWLDIGGTVDPDDPRKHHISDAIAYPGGYPFSDPASVTQDDAIEILCDGTEIRVDPSGEFSIKTSGDISLGDHSLTEKAAVASKVLTRLSDIESKLNNFISSYGTHIHPTTAPAAPTGPPLVPETPLVPSTDPIESTKVKVAY